MSGSSHSSSVSPASFTHELFPSSFRAFSAAVPSGARLFFARRQPVAQDAIPILLLHGFPQNHSLWYKLLPHLPAGLDVIVPDLPGYGESTKEPSEDGSARNHSKREMAKDMLALVDILRGPNERVIAYGHDRGARVAYRMALDHPERVLGMAALDIVPGAEQFRAMKLENGRHAEAMTSYHWLFLAQPSPLPDTMIAALPEWYITNCIERWTGKRMRGKYEKAAMDAWVQPYVQNKDNIIGACEDYRAGAGIDLQTEEQESSKLRVPSLILYSASLARHPVKEMWEKHIEPGFTDYRIAQTGDEQVGHFNVIEAQDAILAETLPWLEKLGVRMS